MDREEMAYRSQGRSYQEEGVETRTAAVAEEECIHLPHLAATRSTRTDPSSAPPDASLDLDLDLDPTCLPWRPDPVPDRVHDPLLLPDRCLPYQIRPCPSDRSLTMPACPATRATHVLPGCEGRHQMTDPCRHLRLRSLHSCDWILRHSLHPCHPYHPYHPCPTTPAPPLATRDLTHACAAPSDACCQSGSRSSPRWRSSHSRYGHTTQILHTHPVRSAGQLHCRTLLHYYNNTYQSLSSLTSSCPRTPSQRSRCRTEQTASPGLHP